MTNMSWSKRIRDLRIDHDMTKKELSEAADGFCWKLLWNRQHGEESQAGRPLHGDVPDSQEQQINLRNTTQKIWKENLPMPKLKTHSGAKKRFNLTASGKVKRAHAYKSHILTKKTTKRTRHLRATAYADQTNVSAIKEMIPYK